MRTPTSSPRRARLAAATLTLLPLALGAIGAVGAIGTAGPAAAAKPAPGGNNGTVKVAADGEFDGIPDNQPHLGCTFQVEWYGYDAGTDIVSTVGFAMMAPTRSVGLQVVGPASVVLDPIVGGGLGAAATYTLAFDGAPHPDQGFHVRVTIATPHSRGSDTKTKVFWVQGCDAVPPSLPS